MKTHALQRRLRFCSFFLAVLWGQFAMAQAQKPFPHLGYVYPAGGKQGTTFTVALGGQNLNGATTTYFSGAGVQARILDYNRPLTQKEVNDLREKMQALQEKRAAARQSPSKPKFTAENEREFGEIRMKLVNRPTRPANPAIAETVILEVTIAAEASLGEREIRIKTPNGLSNPFTFNVGQLPEFSEPAVMATTNVRPRPSHTLDPKTGRPIPTGAEIKLPTIVNGQILPGEVDAFRFAAQKGQRITIAVSARGLIPYLADAVPGWFQATIALYDASGREVGYAGDFRFNPDPVLFYEIAKDGDYTIEIKDSIYRGREDFIYRIAIGELPFVRSIFPLAAQTGNETTFDMAGWNLPAAKLQIATGDKSPGTFVLSVRNRELLSNSVRFVLDPRPETLEAEPNSCVKDAQKVTLPIAVDGRIDRAGDQDVYCFAGKAGGEIVAEVLARRLNSPVDSVLTLTDAAGKVIASNDDYDDKAAGLLTHQADSRLSTVLPADGVYYLQIADAQHQGGADYSYHLRIGPPRPDFELRVVPATINLRANMCAPITVYALRRDGFTGPIAVGLNDAPRGFALSGARIGAGEDKVQMTLTAPSSPRDEPYTLSVVGLATIGGKTVTHFAVPAEDMMQAFAYRHLVTAKELKADVTGRGVPFRLLAKLPLQIPAGGMARLRIATPAARNVGKIQLELAEPIEGVTLKSSTSGGDYVDVVLSCDAAKIKISRQGNLLFNAFGERANSAKKNPAKGGQRVPLGVVPAIPFEIVAANGPAA